jgi:hypothetical protein
MQQMTTVRVTRRTARLIGMIANMVAAQDASANVSADVLLTRVLEEKFPEAVKLFNKESKKPQGESDE